MKRVKKPRKSRAKVKFKTKAYVGNPGKKAEQAEEIARLKKGMSELQVGMSDIKAMLTRALNNGLKKEEK